MLPYLNLQRCFILPGISLLVEHPVNIFDNDTFVDEFTFGRLRYNQSRNDLTKRQNKFHFKQITNDYKHLERIFSRANHSVPNWGPCN